MKKLLLLSALILFSGFALKAQKIMNDPGFNLGDLSRKENKIASEHQKSLRSQPAGEKYLKDSSYSYLWIQDINDWDSLPDSKTKLVYNSRGLNTNYNTYSWDNVDRIWVDNYEYHSLYDENMNLSEWFYSDYDANSQKWIPYEHDTLAYNNNILVEASWNFYNTLNSTWFTGNYFKYSSSGAPLEYYYMYWDDQTFAIQEGYKTTYTLNSQNLPVETVAQSYDTLTDSWVNLSKIVSDYQDDSIHILDTYYQWNSSTGIWDLNQQEIYTYTNKLVTEILTQSWVVEMWVNEMKENFEYSPEKFVTKDLRLTWDGAAWVNYWQILYTYNPGNVMTEKLWQAFVNDSWANSSMDGYSFDDQGNMTARIHKRWDTSTGALVGSSYQYLFSFDSNNSNTETVFQGWNTEALDWQNYVRTLNYYSLHSYFSVPDQDRGSVSVYPNPARNTLFVNGLTGNEVVSITDMTGKQATSSRITGNQIDISNLQTGLYTLKIGTSNGTIIRKFVKQ